MCFAELKRRENKNLAGSNQVKKIKRLNRLQREQRGKNRVCRLQFLSFKSCRLVLFWYGEFVRENLCQNIKHSFTFKNVCKWLSTALFKVWLSWQFQNTVSINIENSIITGLRAGNLLKWAQNSVKKTKLKYDFQMSFCPKSFQCYDWCENFFFLFLMLKPLSAGLSIHCLTEGHCPHQDETCSTVRGCLAFGWKTTHINELLIIGNA